MKCYSVPYEGNQEYIFFSYCHDDAPLVYQIIERLSIEGFRVWFDDGMHPGDDWPEVIATHLCKATVCIAAISKASAESHNCRNEVSFAIANNKPFVSVVIEDFPMPLGMQLQLSSSYYIKKNDYSLDAFYHKLICAPTIAACRNAGHSASPAALVKWRNHVKEYEQGPSPIQLIVSRGLNIHSSLVEGRKRLEDEIAALKNELGGAEGRFKPEKESGRTETEEEQIQLDRKNAEQERLAREAEEKRLAEEEARRRAEQERLAREAEEKRRAEEEARRRAEQERLAREAEEKRLAEEEARRRAEQERLAREAEEKRLAEEEARRRAEQERLAREAEEKRLAEEEARRRAEQERLAREAEEKRLAEEEARRRAEQERLAREAEEKARVNLKKDVAVSGSTGSSTPESGDAMLIRLGTGEIFKIRSNLVRIGRSKDSDIVFSGNRAISRSHLEIESNGKNYTLKNLSSSVVEVNGSPVQTGERITLSEYAEITVSNEQCFFVSGSIYCRIFEERKLKMLKCKETGETRLLIEDVFPLDRYHKWKHNILGDQRISRENHAVIFKSGSQSMLRDGGSLNGTFLNAKRINAGEDALIQNGDTIAVVETEFTYYESII